MAEQESLQKGKFEIEANVAEIARLEALGAAIVAEGLALRAVAVDAYLVDEVRCARGRQRIRRARRCQRHCR